uniref:Uncharacterized protein n=1 Tax=Anguilla anguilla TaxID=7936 RepID=A0A0E9QY40_ANGAN
MTAFWEQGIQR